MGSVTAAAVLLLRLIFNKSIKKSVFVILWIVVLFRLAIPLSIPSPTSVFNLFNNSSTQASVSNTGIADLMPNFIRDNLIYENEYNVSQDNSVYNQSKASEAESPDVAAAQDVIDNTDRKISQNTPVTSGYSISFSDIAAIIWLAGIIVLASFGGTVYFLTLRKIKKSAAFEHIVLNECKQSLNMKRHIKMLKSKEIESPFVYGIFKSKILLPESVTKADNKSLAHILMHELVHIKRFDNMLKLISSLILCIHWYNPIVWLCYVLMQRDIESSCDEKVLAVLGYNARGEYAFSLYEFASRKYSIESAGFTSFSEANTKSRISNVLNYKKSSISAMIISLCIIVSIIIGYATNPLSNNNAPFYDSKVVYVAEDGLYYANISDGKGSLLVKGNDISTPIFSDNGKTIAFKQGEDLYAYVFSDSKTKLLIEDVISYCKAQGDEFYASSEKEGIVIIDAGTGKKTTVVPAEENTCFEDLKLSPDYKKLAYYKEQFEYVYDEKSQQNVKMLAERGTWLYNAETDKTQLILKGIKHTETTDSTGGTRPIPAKWAPDSNKIFIWILYTSGSTSTDGVPAAVYDIESGKLTRLDSSSAGIALHYDENVSFASPTTLAMISGTERTTYRGKYLSIIDLNNGASAKIIETPGIVPSTPYYSSDGKKLLFAASQTIDDGEYYSEDYEKYITEIANRQIYMQVDGKLYKMTNDKKYRSEIPVFMKNNNYIVFARVGIDGEGSLWIMDSDGKNQRKLVGWNSGDQIANVQKCDFYGRIDWNTIYDIYDGTKAAKSSKKPADMNNNTDDGTDTADQKHITNLIKYAEPYAKSYISDRLQAAYSKFYNVESIDFKFIKSTEYTYISPDKKDFDQGKPSLDIEYVVTVNYRNYYKDPDTVDYIATLRKKAQNESDPVARDLAQKQYEQLYKEYNEVKQTNHIYKCTFKLDDNFTVDKGSLKIMAEDADGNFTIPFEEMLPGK